MFSASRLSFADKLYRFPSGNVVKVQGYEPFCLNYLLKNTKVREDQIKVARSDVPEIWYLFNGKRHRYYCDIWIQHLNFLIEVKSMFTMKIDPERISCKFNAAKRYGYNIEIWVFERDGRLLNKIKHF
jgi:hypothetical protein